MRPISELLEILRDRSRNKNNRIRNGLCAEVYFLHSYNLLSQDEYCLIMDYFIENLPNKSPYEYSFPVGDWLPRLKWLNEHIELNKEKEQ